MNDDDRLKLTGAYLIGEDHRLIYQKVALLIREYRETCDSMWLGVDRLFMKVELDSGENYILLGEKLDELREKIEKWFSRNQFRYPLFYRGDYYIHSELGGLSVVKPEGAVDVVPYLSFEESDPAEEDQV